MKKFFLVFLVFLCLFPLKVLAISAGSYIVMDQKSHQVLKGSNIHNSKLIASTTNIMTT